MYSERIFSTKVIAGQRIRIPRNFTQGIEWLADKKSDVFAKAIVGDDGGVQISPTLKIQEQIEKLLSEKDSDEFGPKSAPLSRLKESIHDVKFEFESSRFTLVFPKYFRDIKALPSRIAPPKGTGDKNQKEGPKAVLWIHGSVLEIWPASDWANHLRDVISRINEYSEEQE
jgi:hypothetical protein